MEWIQKVIADKVVVLVKADTQENEGVPRVGVIYEQGVSKKSGMPYVRMLVTHAHEDEGSLVELEEPKFRTVNAESLMGFHHRRMPHLEYKDPTDYMKGGGK